MEGKSGALLLAILSTGILLQILGCAIWNNWWPSLVMMMYVLVPMPYMFFSGRTAFNSGVSDGWKDTGRFITGFAAIVSFAVPGILYHAGVIVSGAFAMEMVASAMILGSGLMYDYFASQAW